MSTEAEISRACDELLAVCDPARATAEEFLGCQFDMGLAWVPFPIGLGGRATAPALQQVVDARLTAAGAPSCQERNPIGHGMAAPTILAHGSDEQHRLLRALFTGEEIWCQLFSEPGAGSDVAGLGTTAVLDGDEWIVNGQKVWTTLAHVARWGMLVARTDPNLPKHQGMTYFVLDMRAPGVDVRPLMQLTGEAEFNEVFLSDVRVSDSARLAGVGEGWRVVLTTLMNERVAIGGTVPSRGGGFIGEAMPLWQGTEVHGAATRDELVRLWIRAEVLRLTNIRAAQTRAAGTPGPEGSIGKVLSAELNQDISRMAVDLLGPGGMLMPEPYPMDRPKQATLWPHPQGAFLRALANSIEGGTSEIARNVLGERVLGLHAEVRVDKAAAWNDVRRA